MPGAKGTRPGRRSVLSPISEIKKVAEPVKQENKAGAQINPATEDTLAALETVLGAVADAVVAAGATGSLSAKLRRLTTDLDALKTLIGEVQASPTENTLLERQKVIETALIAINTLIGEVQASPTANTLLARLKDLLTGIIPLEVAAQHGVAETADTDILGSDITPTNTPCLFRTMVMLETTGVFSAMLKNDGVTKQLKLNGAVALTADCAYMFDILVHSGDTVNFQTSASGNVTLRIQEIVGGVQ